MQRCGAAIIGTSAFVQLTVVVFLFSSSTQAQRPEKSYSKCAAPNSTGNQKSAAQAGKSMFENICSACHGVKGQGARGSKLADSEYIRQMSSREIFDVIRNGVRGTEMIAFPLEEKELWALVAFVRSLNAVAAEQEVRGNYAAGQSLFFGKAGCSSCHMIAGRGGLLGPDLSNIGQQRSVEKISTAVLQPNAEIEPKYRRVLVVTHDGRKIEGLVKNESTYSIQLLDLQANFHFISKNDLQTIVSYKESLMPVSDLSEQDFGDLLAFLCSQTSEKSAEPQAQTNDGGRIY